MNSMRPPRSEPRGVTGSAPFPHGEEGRRGPGDIQGAAVSWYAAADRPGSDWCVASDPGRRAEMNGETPCR
jgi:hypothetical protein